MRGYPGVIEKDLNGKGVDIFAALERIEKG
jgi:hypothetical protein